MLISEFKNNLKFSVLRDHEIKGRRVDIKKAIARDDMGRNEGRGGGRDNDRNRGRGGRDNRGNGDFRSKYLHLFLA